MVHIKPFKALRPKEELVYKVNCPPYDIISSDEAKKVIKENPYSFLQVIKPEATINSEQYLSSFQLAKQAAKNLQELIKRKVFLREEEDSFYIYRQSNDTYKRTGLVACLSVADYEKGIIKRHENINLDTQKERADHIMLTKAHTGCALVVYKSNPHIEELLKQEINNKREIYNFKSDDGFMNSCWRIKKKETIDSLISFFRQIPSLYIADGHHRVAAAVKVAKSGCAKKQKKEQKEEYSQRECNYFPALLVPHKEIQILPYHRIAIKLPSLQKEDFLRKLGQHFQVEKINSHIPFLPSKKHEFGMNIFGQWYRLLYKEDSISNTKINIITQLDVTILQDMVLKPLLEAINIKQNNVNNIIEYVGGVKALPQIKERIKQESNLIFTLFPVSIEEVIEVCERNQIMPPKSTWFEPKMRSGVFIHLFA